MRSRYTAVHARVPSAVHAVHVPHVVLCPQCLPVCGPQVFGVKNSLNVSVCASIVLYEVPALGRNRSPSPSPSPKPKAQKTDVCCAVKGVASLGQVRGGRTGENRLTTSKRITAKCLLFRHPHARDSQVYVGVTRGVSFSRGGRCHGTVQYGCTCSCTVLTAVHDEYSYSLHTW